MRTCCVYDEYWPICLPLEGKHVLSFGVDLIPSIKQLVFLTEMEKGAFSHFII